MEDDLVKKRWSIGRKLGVIVPIILIVLLVGAVIFHLEDQSSRSPSGSSSGQTASKGSRPGSAPAANTGSSTANGSVPGSQTSQLTNTGPGDTEAIFIGTVVIATICHYLWKRSKVKQP